MGKIQKLVRDNIIDIIKDDGRRPIYRQLNQKEYKSELEKKLLEEVAELIDAKEYFEKIEELADIYEVLEAYQQLLNIESSQVEVIKKKKKKQNGSFIKRIYLEEVNND